MNIFVSRVNIFFKNLTGKRLNFLFNTEQIPNMLIFIFRFIINLLFDLHQQMF
jgi:hypothetical protein